MYDDIVGAFWGKSGAVAQVEMKAARTADRAAVDAAFAPLYEAGGEVGMTPYVTKIDDAIAKVRKSGFRDKESVIKELERFRAVAEEPTDWAKAIDMGTDINDAISTIYSAPAESRNLNLARILGPLKKAHQEAMDASGGGYGEIYKQAKEVYRTRMAPWKQPTAGGRKLSRFMESAEPNDELAAMTTSRPDRARLLTERMTPKAKAATAASIVETAFEEAKDGGPKALLRSLGKRRAMSDAALTAEQKSQLDGFEKLVNYASAAGSAVPIGRWGVSTGEIAQKLFTSKAGSRVLLGLSAPPTSKIYKNAIAQLPALLGVEAGSPDEEE
jgi:hypothetical protein